MRKLGIRHAGVVAVSADSVASDRDLVDLLIREWCVVDARAKEGWLNIEPETRDIPVQQRLKAFFNVTLVRAELRNTHC